jgi:hypothetical protein
MFAERERESEHWQGKVDEVDEVDVEDGANWKITRQEGMANGVAPRWQSKMALTVYLRT